MMQETNTIIPAKFKKIRTKNGKEYWMLIFNFSDFVADKRPAECEKKISKELDDLLEKIKKILPNRKPSRVERVKIWEIGDMILNKREEIAKRYGIYITNIIDAVALKLGIAPRTVNFFVQFRRTIPKNKIDEDVPWKVYQITLLLKDKSKFEECINLYKKGFLKTTSEVLEYVQKLNKQYGKVSKGS